MIDFIFYVTVFILVYLVYLLFIVGKKGKLDKYTESVEVKYLISVYKLDIKKLNLKKLAKLLGLSNAFIITLTLFLIGFIENFIIKISVGFVILVILELVIYHMLGKTIKKRGI